MTQASPHRSATRKAVALVGIAVATCALAGCRDKRRIEESGSEVAAASAVVQVTAPTPTAPPVAVSPPHATLVMAWAGKSLFGYFRAELWVHDSSTSVPSQELRLISSDGTVYRRKGRMVKLPPDVGGAGSGWTAFVTSIEEGQRYPNVYPDFLATVSPAGVIRVFEFGTRNETAIELPPVQQSL